MTFIRFPTTLVILVYQIHAKGFTDALHQRYSSNPLYQLINVNVQENILKSILVRMFANSMRSQVPAPLHPTYLISTQNMEYLREPMGCTNSKVGYVYLIDENLRIRWAVCADPTPDEAHSLEVCTGVLLNRLEKKPKPAKPRDLSSSLSTSVQLLESDLFVISIYRHLCLALENPLLFYGEDVTTICVTVEDVQFSRIFPANEVAGSANSGQLFVGFAFYLHIRTDSTDSRFLSPNIEGFPLF